MFSAIKKGIQKRAFESLRVKVSSVRNRRFTSIDKVRSALLLYRVENENNLTELYDFIDTLIAKNIEVDVIMAGRPKNLQSAYPKTATFHRISLQEVKWNGEPKNEAILKTLQKDHDYFIDLSFLGSNLCTYLATASLAKFKIGGVMVAESPFDLTVDVNGNHDLGYFESQMLAYLQKIG